MIIKKKTEYEIGKEATNLALKDMIWLFIIAISIYFSDQQYDYGFVIIGLLIYFSLFTLIHYITLNRQEIENRLEELEDRIIEKIENK